MGIFSRFRDIVSSNLNSMLDKAEDPEKLLKLVIREMEDTLVELKASCAGCMAERSKVERGRLEAESRVNDWSAKAELALSKGREDLAREALLEKRAYTDRVGKLTAETTQHEEVVAQYQSDINELEAKLNQARDKQRVLLQRHEHATQKKRAQGDIRKFNVKNTAAKFEQFENRIDRLEAEADLVNPKTKPSLDDEFSRLAQDDAIEAELAGLKEKMATAKK
ncbi:phage shock protein PspA [Cerasicoccus arenae]|uniref:Phage shock protein A n=1 Tax=Cerasicoccus arenae TaxID=424488 RepID=A0A8J3GDK0_9BACT|nr:phage shock protein PspA [Cerasicoccus arenae]MBK1859624.1 phage shock protein PspA [Cerasicoccus arenae]GHB96331.1 phage shock protein A [Cerasicoccus arenae]